MSVSLAYGDVFTIASATGFNVRSFRINSIFDPDATGAGGQPTFYTQLAALYDEYLVTSADITVEFKNKSAKHVMAGFVWHAINAGPISTGVQAQQLMLEGNKSRMTWLSSASSAAGVQERNNILTAHIDMLQNEGSRGGKADQDYAAAFGANPFSEMDLDVVGIDTLNGNETIDIDFIIKIVYNVTVRGLSSTYLD
jgi:hypothetical protein